MTDLDAELVAHAQGRRPLTRPLLCGATGMCDPRPDGTCRDCEGIVGDDPVCESSGGWSLPDEAQP